MADDEEWTTAQVREYLKLSSADSARVWLRKNGVEAVRRDLATPAKLYRAEDVRAVERRPSGRPKG